MGGVVVQIGGISQAGVRETSGLWEWPGIGYWSPSRGGNVHIAQHQGSGPCRVQRASISTVH